MLLKHMRVKPTMNPIESIVSRFLANTTHRESLVEVNRLIVETVELNIVREAVLLTKRNVRSAINTTILLVVVELALVR